MKKHITAYVILWLPAVLAAYFFSGLSMLSQGLQWATAALMVIGWSVNTGFAAYRFPKTTLAILLIYAGANTLLIALLYKIPYESPYHQPLLTWGGIASFKPLDILVQALLDFNIPQELYVLGLVVGLSAVAYIIGISRRRTHPYPYRPKIIRGK